MQKFTFCWISLQFFKNNFFFFISLGDEDHLGDMDFKVAGTESGITALQMDIKIQGINEAIMDVALTKAKAARHHILNEMNAVINKANELSEHTPAMKKFVVHTDKIKERCMVLEGSVLRSKPVRVLRDEIVIFEGELDSLRRFKDDIGEVKNGTECGIGIKNYKDVKAGDKIEVFDRKVEAQTL